MKKAFATVFLALLIVSSLSLVSAKTLIAGKIYNSDYSDTIANANVEVTCNGNVQNTTSLSDGAYTVTYDNEAECGYHEPAHILIVYAEKDGLSGSKSGEIHEDVINDWDLAIVNVPLIPEFGIAIGLLTLLSAVTVFFVIRRK